MKDAELTDEIVDQADDTGAGVAAGNGADEDGDADLDAEMSDERVDELERELTLARDKHLRLAAEFDNFRKRMMKERVEAESRGQGELVKHLIDSLDDIARFAHLDPAVTDSATIVEGVAMVEKKLDKALRAAGLELVNPVDEPFDPASHEAVATEPATTPDLDGTVARVYQVGYSFNGQLLRPARVVVRQYPGSH